MDDAEAHLRIGLLRVGIVFLALATAGAHLYYILFDEEIAPLFRLLFIGNFLPYVILVSALYSLLSPLARFRPATRSMIHSITSVVLLRGCSDLAQD